MKLLSYKLKGFNMDDLQKKEDVKETLGFAITLAGFCLIALNEIINYFKQESFTYNYFVALTFIKSILVSVLILLTVFILIRGYSLVLENKDKDKFWYISSLLYSSSFVLFFYALCISVYMYISFFYLADNFILASVGYILLIFIPFAITLYVSVKSKKAALIIFLVLPSIVAYGFLFSAFVDHKSPTMDIEIDELYEIDNQLIPISIKINGYNNALSVEMYQENSSHDLNFIDKNIMFTDSTDKKVEHGKYIFGNYLNNGNYIVFVNTTGLESGYYELYFNVYKTSKTVSKGFYLVDENPI
jgi:hypothetical protein